MRRQGQHRDQDPAEVPFQWVGETFGNAGEIDDQCHRRGCNRRFGHDADAAHLDQSGDCRRRRRPDRAVLDSKGNAIIGNQLPAAIDQPQCQVGLAHPRWPDQQHGAPSQRHRDAMDVHADAIGSVTVKVAPPPGVSPTVMPPPCASTMAPAIDSPNPE